MQILETHIEQAYVDDDQEEQARIELYGLSVIEFIQSLISGFEPADNPKTMEGRRYDYGRIVGDASL